MTRIVGISGSLRQNSYNTALLRAAVDLAPEGTTIEVGTIEGIPLYDGDVEARDGIPEAAEKLKDQIAASDGLLLVTPEYNHSIPGVFKNAIDWLSRPGSDRKRVFYGKSVALTGATPGRGGTRMAQMAWLEVFRALGLRPWYGRQLYVAGAGDVFDEERNLVDETIGELLEQFVTDFAASITE